MLFNLQLETLRADLGLIGFPPRSLHNEFFTRFRSIFFLRNRQYSKSVNVPPFLINYSGALFREYPGPWQVMLRQDDGSLVCVAEDDIRFQTSRGPTRRHGAKSKRGLGPFRATGVAPNALCQC